jgi:hypothetical protein
MGKSAGAAPSSPDPAAIIPLQSAANKSDFDYMTQASRINQYGPTGSVTWSQTPGTFDEAGYNTAMQRYNTTPAYRPNGEGNPIGRNTNAMPTKEMFTTAPGAWNQTTSLSPDQQKLQDANTASQLQQSQLLGSMTGQVGQALSKPIDYSSLPQMQGLSGNYNLNTGMAGGPTFYGLDGNAGLQNPTAGAVNRGALPQGGGDPNAYQNYNLQSFNPTQFNPSQAGVNTGAPITGPNATAQNASLNPSQQVNAPGSTAQRADIASGGMVQTPGALINDRSGALSQQLGQYQQALGGLDPYAFNKTAADAVYGQATRYLDPQVKQQQQALEARLSEQGFVPGTPGYQQAMQNFQDTNNRAYADARDRATTQGTSVGQNATSQQMQAIQSQIAAALSGSQFGLSNDQARSTEGLNLANFTSGQNAQDFSQRMQNAQFGANRDDALYGQNMSNAQFTAQQGLNDFTQRLQGAQFNAGRDDSRFSQGLAGAQFASGEQQNQFNRDTTANTNQFNQGLAGAQFNAGQEQNRFANNLQAGQFQNSQNQADFERRNSAANLAAGLQGQDFSQQMALSEQQRQGGLDANAVAQQAFGNRNTATSANNQLMQQQFDNRINELTRQNAAIAQQQGIDINSAQFQNQMRQQAIAEMLQQRAQPLNELSALRSGTQVQMPTGTGQAQTPNMANTDIMGAYNNQYQGQLDAYNAQVGTANSGNAAAGQSIASLAAMAAAMI